MLSPTHCYSSLWELCTGKNNSIDLAQTFTNPALLTSDTHSPSTALYFKIRYFCRTLGEQKMKMPKLELCGFFIFNHLRVSTILCSLAF